MTDAIDIMDAIVGGQMDAQLEALETAIRDRRKIVAKRQLLELKAGDKVRVKGGISPKYLVGATGVVASIGTTRIEVTLDRPVGKFGHHGTPIGFPPGTLEKIGE